MGRHDDQSTQVLQMDWSDCQNHVCVHGCVPGFHRVFGVSLRCKNVSGVRAMALLIGNRASGTSGESGEGIRSWSSEERDVDGMGWEDMRFTFVGEYHSRRQTKPTGALEHCDQLISSAVLSPQSSGYTIGCVRSSLNLPFRVRVQDARFPSSVITRCRVS